MSAYVETTARCPEGVKFLFTKHRAPDCKVIVTVTNPTPEQLAATRKTLGVVPAAAAKGVRP